MTTLTIWGGAGEHGRSSYLIRNDQVGILLDCGVKKEAGSEYPLLEAERIPDLLAVFLSHAHEDHSAALPLLYKYGYRGKVWTTRETAQQLPDYFTAWRNYTASRSTPLPYEEADCEAIEFAYLEEHTAALTWYNLAAGLRVMWGRSGHMIGSIWVALEWEGKKIFFSGDYTGESQLLAVDHPEQGLFHSSLDLSIIDGAYGADPETQYDKLLQLESAIRSTLQIGGTILLPVPLYGRGQDLLVWAGEQFPEAQLIVEKRLLAPLLELDRSSDWLKDKASSRIHALFGNENLRTVSDPDERSQAMQQPQGAIIFTDDGMLISSTARWYYDQLAGNHSSHLIFTGHLPAGSHAHNLLTSPPIGGLAVSFIRYKVHQGLPDIRAMLRSIPSRQNVLVHAPEQHNRKAIMLLQEEGTSGLHSILPGDHLQF